MATLPPRNPITEQIEALTDTGRYPLGDAWEAKPNGKHEEPKQETITILPRPASTLKRDDNARLWIWKGILARGYLTLLSALWKSGKSTLLAHLLHALEGETSFCGLDILPSRVLYVTEEPEGLWAARRDDIGIADHVDFIIQPFLAKPKWDDWHRFLDKLNGFVEAKKYDLVIMDTISNLWPVRDENDASQVVSALMPLRAAVKEASCMPVHHSRKTDGTEATSSRGSGSFPAFVDTIVELRRYNATDHEDCKRVLTAYGRWEETPHEIVIELGGSGYTAHGSKGRVIAEEITTVIFRLLPCEPPGMTWQEVRDEWPGEKSPRTQRLCAALREGSERGNWHQNGSGKKGDPFRYWTSPPAA